MLRLNIKKYGLSNGLLPVVDIDGESFINLSLSSLKKIVSLAQIRVAYANENFIASSGGGFIGFVVSIILGLIFFKAEDGFALAIVGALLGFFIVNQKRSARQDEFDLEISKLISLENDSQDLIKARAKLISYQWKNFVDFINALENEINGLEETGKNWWLSRSSYTLEKAISEMFSRRGFKSSVTASSGDGGIDVIVENFEGRNLYIQCKGWKGKVGPQVIRELVGSLSVLKDSQAKGIVYSSNNYTQGAIDYAHEAKIELWTPDEISNIAEKYKIVS